MGQRSVSILHLFVWEGEESVSCFGLFQHWFWVFPFFLIHLNGCLGNPIYPLLTWTASMIEDGPGSWKRNNLIFICPLNVPSVFSMENLASLSSLLCLCDWSCFILYNFHIYHNVLFIGQVEIFVWKDWMCVFNNIYIRDYKHRSMFYSPYLYNKTLLKINTMYQDKKDKFQ